MAEARLQEAKSETTLSGMAAGSLKMNARVLTENKTQTARTTLRVLLVEDSEVDAQLILALLRQGGYEPIFQRVQTGVEMKAALEAQRWDLVLADYNLPQFDAPSALRLLHESNLDLPFIVVSGGIGEDTAVAAMRAGAHDYLMKQNLARLVPAVHRELREAQNRAARREARHALSESELRYRMLWETATDAIVIFDDANKIHFVNPAVERVFGYKPDDLIGKDVTALQPARLHLLERDAVAGHIKAGIRRVEWRSVETLGQRKDGVEFPAEIAFSEMELEGCRQFVAFIRDITERIRTEKELQATHEQFRVAREIQQRLFPKVAPELDGFEVGGATFPAEAAGGDYFDYLPMSGRRLGLVVGDVTGHGVGPALLMAETRAYLRVLARNHDDLGEIMTRTNRVLAEDVGCERYVTLILAELEASNKVLNYVNAGHPPGFVLSGVGQLKTLLRRTGPPLGIRLDTAFSNSTAIPLAPGDLVLLMTDGFEEAMAPDGASFGLERTLQVVRDHQAESPQKIVQALYDEVRAFGKNTPQEDDLTAVVARVCR